MMTIKKRHLMAWFILLFFWQSGQICLFAQDSPRHKICLAGSSVQEIPEYGQAFYQGAQLAVHQFNQTNPRHLMAVEKFFYEASPLAAQRAIKDMIISGCLAVVGFTNQNELNIVALTAKRSRLLVISLYGELDSLASKVPHVLTMQPSPQQLVQKLELYLRKNPNFKPKKAAVITTVDKASLLDYKEAFLKLFKKLGTKVDEIDLLERFFTDEILVERLEKKPREYDVIALATRATVGAHVVDYFYNRRPLKSPNIPLILGTKNLGSHQLPVFKDQSKSKGYTILLARQNVVSDSDPKYVEFVKLYRAQYQKDPMVISGLAYDAVHYIGQALKKIPPYRMKTPEGARIQLLRVAPQMESDGITGVKFKKGFKVRGTKAFIVKLSDRGYHVVQEFK